MTTKDLSIDQHPATSPALFIPLRPRTWSSFSEHITSLLATENAHVYIDTSFLMWLTKIGTLSRKELFAWFDQTVPDRVHVPVWAAHEYIKHHTRKKLVNDFTARCKNVQSFARRTYMELRPFIDEPVGRRAEDPARFRTEIRHALNELDSLVDRATGWTKKYQSHAAEIIEFINSHTPQWSSVYADLEKVGGYASTRFQGSVPPGFKDRWKSHGAPKSKENAASRPETTTYGDLLLWKEILNHAATINANAIILITNDLKNDWRMGGDKHDGPVEPELQAIRPSWKPVPRPHPMLLFEARTQANVQNLELIDNIYLGAYLKQTAETTTPAFCDVALSPDPTNGDDSSIFQPPASSDKNAELSASPMPDAPEDKSLFSDPPKVLNNRSQLRRALLRSRQALDHLSQQLLDSWLHPQSFTSPFDRIEPARLSDVDHFQLSATARALHDSALSHKAGYTEALADITAALTRMPPNTAAAVYLGFLSSMYFENPDNDTRFPPCSPAAKRLLELQDCDFAHHAVTVVSRHLQRAQERPLYIPTPNPRHILLTLDTEPNRSPSNQLASVRFHTQEDNISAFPVELLHPVKTRESLHLATLFGLGNAINAMSVIAKAAEIYTFPTESLKVDGSPDQKFVIPDALSFRNPRDLRIQKET